MNLAQMLAMTPQLNTKDISASEGRCSCGGRCKLHIGQCTRRALLAGACEVCHRMHAMDGAPQETPTKVQVPSDLAHQKGVLPVGDWIGKKLTPTTISTPSALIGDSGVVSHDQHGELAVDLPSDVINNKGKFIENENMVASSLRKSIHAGGPGSGRHKEFGKFTHLKDSESDSNDTFRRIYKSPTGTKVTHTIKKTANGRDTHSIKETSTLKHNFSSPETSTDTLLKGATSKSANDFLKNRYGIKNKRM